MNKDKYKTIRCDLVNKSFIALALLLPAIMWISCSAPKQFHYFRTGEVTCVSNNSRLVTVASIYQAGTSQQAQLFAERNAVENLLFKGVSGCYDVPLVDNETKSREMHPAFYQWLIENREYERFLTEKTSDFHTSGETTRATMHLTFDVPALRKEMENQGVIKKFGI